MPRFTGQNKKRRNPRYFINEDLASSLFLKARESAELDILSYFEMPDASKADSVKIQRHMPESKKPDISQLRDYLLYNPDGRTSGFNFSRFAKEPVPEDQANKLAQKVGLDMNAVLGAHNAKSKDASGKTAWPLPGLDITNYMVYYMVDNGTLTRFNDGRVAATPRGAKRFHELMKSKRQDLPDTIQGGEDARFTPRQKTPGRPFNASRFTK